jgi:hypothetical protein
MSSSDKFCKYTVPQLKQYLEERGVTVSGYRRPLLLELANAVDRVQLPVDPDFQNVVSAFDSVSDKLKVLGIDDPWSLQGFSQDFLTFRILDYMTFLTISCAVEPTMTEGN